MKTAIRRNEISSFRTALAAVLVTTNRAAAIEGAARTAAATVRVVTEDGALGLEFAATTGFITGQ